MQIFLFVKLNGTYSYWLECAADLGSEPRWREPPSPVCDQ